MSSWSDDTALGLTLGAFDLVGEGESWIAETIAGTDLSGNPVPVEVAVQTLIQDGSVAYTEKFDNATIPVVVRLRGPDAESLDAGAGALFAELERPNVLAYWGPQASEPVAWDVVNSHLVKNGEDDLADRRGERVYTVSLTVLPFRRKTTETVTEALPTGGSTTTNIDSGSSASGWSGSINGVTTAPSSSGGAVRITGTVPKKAQGPGHGGVDAAAALVMKRTGTIDTSALPLIAVTWKVTRQVGAGPTLNFANVSPLAATAGGLALQRVAQQGLASGGWMKTWFEALGSSSVDLQIATTANTAPLASDVEVSLLVDSVDITDEAPTHGPGQQQFRAIEVKGSARTSGAVAIEHESSSLGEVLAFFWLDDQSGYMPNCRQYRVSGGSTTSSTSAISGAFESLQSTTVTFDIPAQRVPVDGYLLAARLGGFTTATGSTAADVSGNVTWTATTRINDVDVGPTLTGTQPVTVNGYQVVTLGEVNLPTRDIDEAGSGAVVRLTLAANAAIRFDELLIYRDSGQLVQADCGTGSPSSGGPSNRLRIEPPNLQRTRPVVRRGYAADWSDSFRPPTLSAWEPPVFVGGKTVLVHVVTTNATGASVSFRHYERLAG